MASALLHMSCPQLKNDIIVMESNSYNKTLQGIERAKRDHDLDELDRNQVKKRRKQSKPNRIATEFPENEVKSSIWISLPHQDHGQLNQENICYENEKNEENDQKTDSDGSEEISCAKKEFPLNLSHKTPSPHGSVDSLSSNLDERGWYKNSENASLLYNMHNSENSKNQYNSVFQSTQGCGIVLPNFKRIIGNSESQIHSPHRIFNPEAFCDLCNKEFCNKYFLKTHKANKHGIYMENGPSSMENLSTLPLMNFFSNSIANLTLSNSQPKKPTPNFTNNSNSNKSNSSMRAFCNICQREFCNKYFVRRHKAKIHGIIENSDSLDYKPCEKLDCEPNMPGPSSVKSKDIMGKDLNEIEDEKNWVKKEDFDSEDANSPHDALSLLVSSWQNEESKEQSRSPERTKKASTTNSAFCDICCKEYCNKYFLRVHKQKCHGILISEKDEKSRDSGSFKSNQPMPLNLILREINKNQNETTHVCTVCKMSFADSHSMNIHEQTHKNSATDVQFNELGKKAQGIENQQNKQNFDIRKHMDSPNNFQENVSNNVDFKKVNSILSKFNLHDNSVCDLCSQDFGNMASLESHILREHSSLIEDINNSYLDEANPAQNCKLECAKCQQIFPNPTSLEQHFCESKPNIKLNETQDIQAPISLTERHVVHTPTSSFCEICKKELCNKYFMKTHMQRMHGISIENGAHIGGVVCDICNKELCSKYFLRVHKQNSHGIVEEAFLPQIGADIKTISNVDMTLKPESELSNKYYSHFTEVCVLCSRRFRSTKWLKAHLLNDHGEEGKDKWREIQQNGTKSEKMDSKKIEPYFNPFKNLMNENGSEMPSTSEANEMPSFMNKIPSKEYQCSYCPFITPALALLLVHERTHIANELQEVRCPICSVSCESNEALDKHMFSHQTQFSFKKTFEETRYENPHIFQFDEIEKKIIKKDDNNYEEISPKAKSPSGVCLKCNQCSYVAQHLDLYSDHIKNEHKSVESPDYLQIIRDALLQIANNSHIPASFAVPNNLGNFMMQPFVLEDKAYGANACNTFLSSLVFLPVKERLNKPVTASFKLTPT